ncbi:MAG: poly-gamma-glutamate synthase PgsB [Candidatus Electryoneaceae bacterium]|nr:poly-gamma-glutamate synthase PgsB [Candidatus Electryoneaceae bacterium]
MLILLLIVAGLCCYGVWEYRHHQKGLDKIPLRIHVNGSRGKSSVVRLIAAGLRAGGIPTVAKVTGTLPRIIDLDGNEVAIVRNQRANIIEQTKVLPYIEKRKPQVVVIECMAVLPEYQWICERQMVRSHIGVITNARLDHTNEMGKFREQIALSLANTCPTNGILYTSEKTHFQTIKKIADKLGTKTFRVGGSGNVTADEMKRFSYIEHPANVGLSLAVCEQAGVDRQIAIEGMYRVVPDTGALRVARCLEGDKEVVFVNALAANDPESSFVIAKHITEHFSPLGTEIILLNSRADRQDRRVQFIEMMAQRLEFDHLILTGEELQKFIGFATRYHIPKSKIIGLGRMAPEKVYQKIFELADGSRSTVLGIGNMGAGGIDIFRYFYNNRRKDV